ncbi:MAG TPA: maleylpyruvate isomerase family mycothiol-dependent enzyme [Gemmatimonadales bacterium]|nr:maleylpyruvate isomerase family mycothiol-dependent enzyme [Gemmatimonadales bacterium]
MTISTARLLEALRVQGSLLFRAATRGMQANVPSCPGWTVGDVVGHVGGIHRHKELVVRTLAQEEPRERAEPPEDPEDRLAWYAEGLDLLLDTLETADPEARVWTWHEPDQSVGFWVRRMAHETAIHRADTELPRGVPTALDPELASDGIDEVLGPVIAAYTTDPADEFRPDGRVVELNVTETGMVRRLHLGTGGHGPGWTYGPGEHGTPTTVITARASDLDLWAWGRAPETVLTVQGDPDPVVMVRRVVASVT